MNLELYLALKHRKYPLGEALIKVKRDSRTPGHTPGEMPAPFPAQRRQRASTKVEERSHQGQAGRAAGPWGGAGRWYPSPCPLPAAVGVTGLPKTGLEVVISSFLHEDAAPAALEVGCLVATVLGGGKDWLILQAGCSRLFQIRDVCTRSYRSPVMATSPPPMSPNPCC